MPREIATEARIDAIEAKALVERTRPQSQQKRTRDAQATHHGCEVARQECIDLRVRDCGALDPPQSPWADYAFFMLDDGNVDVGAHVCDARSEAAEKCFVDGGVLIEDDYVRTDRIA